ncbi:MAG: alpha-L-fucosidase [Oscillospiraceae bacterium]|nr:alpha-L-fucosidase [Oscillospiraceae bacterium]
MCNNTIPTPAPYIKDFEQLGFGMFVHYGLYSQLNSGEWTFHRNEDVKMEEYEKLIDTFQVRRYGGYRLHRKGCWL